jgi:predicted ATPase
MAIEKLTVDYFTVFDHMELEFCPGINIFIGENGTGKTHLLKCIYSFCCYERVIKENGTLELYTSFESKLKECFQRTSYINLAHKNPGVFTSDRISFLFVSFNIEHYLEISNFLSDNGRHTITVVSDFKKQIPSVYIPVKEMLTHSGIEKDYTQRNLPLDITLIDILNKTGVSTVKNLSAEMIFILEKIEAIIGGKVIYNNDRYYIEKPDSSFFDFTAEAEGIKKLSLIYRLIETGNLVKGSVLLWDEPEANMNPKLTPALVDILFALERAGVQIFIATHDYVLLKYLDIKKNASNKTKFISLYKDEGNVRSESSESFAGLENNPISDAYNALLDEVYNDITGEA